MKDKIKCKICGSEMKQVNNRHLRFAHGMTTDEYRRQFPDAQFMSDDQKNRVTEHCRSQNEKRKGKKRSAKDIAAIRNGIEHRASIPWNKKELTEQDLQKIKKHEIFRLQKQKEEDEFWANRRNVRRENKINEYLKRFKDQHGDRYDYSLVEYKGPTVPVKIICPDHGIFEQSPDNHFRGQGCRKCNVSISKGEVEWLDYLGVEKRQIKVEGILVDGFDPETNTVYEYNGDFWHGNPEIYEGNQIAIGDKTFGDLYEATKSKQTQLEKAGFQVVSIWESEWNKIKKKGEG